MSSYQTALTWGGAFISRLQTNILETASEASNILLHTDNENKLIRVYVCVCVIVITTKHLDRFKRSFAHRLLSSKSRASLLVEFVIAIMLNI